MTKKKEQDKEPEITNPACRQLFDYARRFVSLKDIADFCPSDPGYRSYVLEFNGIWETGRIPAATNFDISETVGLTRWADASKEKDPVRFRRFRVFTNSVGLAISVGQQGPGDDLPVNYFAASLLDDALALDDSALLQQLGPVFGELHLRVKDTEWVVKEGMFLLLGQMILSFMAYRTKDDVPRLAEQILKEADYYRPKYPAEFFWECTCFDQLHPVWKSLVKRSFPVHHENESVALLYNMLASVEN